MNDVSSEPVLTTVKGRVGCFLLILALIGAGAWWYKNRVPADASMGGPGDGRKGRSSIGLPVPVSVEEIKKEDFEEWINISGTVTPLNVVTVRSRVDGELQKVHFKEGQLVKAGDILAELDPRPFQVQLDQARGLLEKDEALLANAKADLVRYEALLKQDSIAKQQVDTQASLVRQSEAALVGDRAAIASAELQLSYAKITAPITGRLGLRQIDVGNMIHPGDANGLIIITQMDPMGLVFSIPQERVANVRKLLQASAEVPVEAVDKEMNVSLAKGKLLTTDNQIDLASGTLKLKAELPNADGALFPNQFVITKLLVDTQRQATVAPANAVLRGDKGPYTYVVKADNTVELRPVVTGAMRGERLLVKEGLTPGEKVVTQGVDRMRDGGKVEVIPPGKIGERPPADGGKGGRPAKGPPVQS
jgi:multidrug efflux system membrane fusion protein